MLNGEIVQIQKHKIFLVAWRREASAFSSSAFPPACCLLWAVRLPESGIFNRKKGHVNKIISGKYFGLKYLRQNYCAELFPSKSQVSWSSLSPSPPPWILELVKVFWECEMAEEDLCIHQPLSSRDWCMHILLEHSFNLCKKKNGLREEKTPYLHFHLFWKIKIFLMLWEASKRAGIQKESILLLPIRTQHGKGRWRHWRWGLRYNF